MWPCEAAFWWRFSPFLDLRLITILKCQHSGFSMLGLGRNVRNVLPCIPPGASACFRPTLQHRRHSFCINAVLASRQTISGEIIFISGASCTTSFPPLSLSRAASQSNYTISVAPCNDIFPISTWLVLLVFIEAGFLPSATTLGSWARVWEHKETRE